MNVVVIDDDPELCTLLATALGREGHTVRTAGSLATGREQLEEIGIDVVVLDLGLPDGDGLQLCRELRATGRPIGILVLSAAGAVTARVDGLDAGADDYLVKPFAVAELRARVRALSRRAVRSAAAPPCRRADVELDFASRRARRAGLEIALTAREWSILEAIAAGEGRVVARDVLLRQVWGEVSDAAAASFGVLLVRIRHKLGRDLIRTVRGQGHALG
ncbi:MAG: response regulator transcription factor [Deltaproteobacteria bacterium]|nr:response regulator transcription factor [Deltaproteobacteria bacterium]MBP7289373.1 response regulator transcription factor [Nannocystaceae bacterium]